VLRAGEGWRLSAFALVTRDASVPLRPSGTSRKKRTARLRILGASKNTGVVEMCVTHTHTHTALRQWARGHLVSSIPRVNSLEIAITKVINCLKPLKMDPIEGSETSANINQTLGIHPKIETVNTEQSESLKSRN
jgi:hypothetical protein